MDQEAMLVHDLAALDFELRESNITNGGLKSFVTKQFGLHEVICTNYGPIYYEKLSVGTSSRRPI